MIQLYYFKDPLSLKLIITTTNTIRSKCYQSYQSSRGCVGSAHSFYDVYSFHNDRCELKMQLIRFTVSLVSLNVAASKLDTFVFEPTVLD